MTSFYSTANPLISLRAITKTYQTPTGDFDALKNIKVDFGRGEFISVVGKSGSGKSTLLNMLTGIDRPSQGTVMIDGTNIHELSESKIARWRGTNMGIVFQFYQLLPMLSILENVMLPMDFSDSVPEGDREARALELLNLVGLSDVAQHMPSAVSGGQQQSAAIARALANNPPILVADEPTGNLDSRAADVIFHIFDTLAIQGKTIIMVTHDDALAERASRLVRLVDGEIAEIVSLRQPVSRKQSPAAVSTRFPLMTPTYALAHL